MFGNSIGYQDSALEELLYEYGKQKHGHWGEVMRYYRDMFNKDHKGFYNLVLNGHLIGAKSEESIKSKWHNSNGIYPYLFRANGYNFNPGESNYDWIFGENLTFTYNNFGQKTKEERMGLYLRNYISDVILAVFEIDNNDDIFNDKYSDAEWQNMEMRKKYLTNAETDTIIDTLQKDRIYRLYTTTQGEWRPGS